MPQKTANPNDPPLTFQWVEPLRQGRRLGFWMFVVFVGLVAFFYLFQVVYPQTQRFTPVPQQIIALNPADPSAVALLSRVQDRDYLLLPSDNYNPASGPSLQESAPVFHPSFEGHQLKVQDLPYKAFTVPPARLLNVDKPVLPPLDLSDLKGEPRAPAPGKTKERPSPAQAKLVVNFVGDLAKRELVAQPDLSEVPLAYPESCRFQMGVDAAGRVEFILPVNTSEKPEVTPQMAGQLLDRLQALRFQPQTAASGGKSNAGPTWGTAILFWAEPDVP